MEFVKKLEKGIDSSVG
jgi:ATP-binding cassette, subfamily B, bacterial MsbA